MRLHDLAKRPERHPLAVGQRATLAPIDQLPVLFDRVQELDQEPALAHSRDADKGDELRRALLTDARQSRDEQLEFALAPNERRDGSLHNVDAEASARLQSLPDGDRLALPLGDD